MNRRMNTVSAVSASKGVCTCCGRCRAVCPACIDIPAVLQRYTLHAKNGWDAAASQCEPTGPEDCIECGACTACCPEEIPVKELMRELAMRQCNCRGQPASV